MKNKGFTLVELLAVVVVLAIIMIIAVPNVMKTLNASKTGLSNFEKKNIEDAAERLITEVINCEISNNTISVLQQYDITIVKGNTCKVNQKKVIGKTINNITVKSLRDNKYIDDVKSRCNGKIEITVDANNYKVTVDTSNVVCEG